MLYKTLEKTQTKMMYKPLKKPKQKKHWTTMFFTNTHSDIWTIQEASIIYKKITEHKHLNERSRYQSSYYNYCDIIYNNTRIEHNNILSTCYYFVFLPLILFLRFVVLFFLVLDFLLLPPLVELSKWGSPVIERKTPRNNAEFSISFDSGL